MQVAFTQPQINNYNSIQTQYKNQYTNLATRDSSMADQVSFSGGIRTKSVGNFLEEPILKIKSLYTKNAGIKGVKKAKITYKELEIPEQFREAHTRESIKRLRCEKSGDDIRLIPIIPESMYTHKGLSFKDAQKICKKEMKDEMISSYVNTFGELYHNVPLKNGETIPGYFKFTDSGVPKSFCSMESGITYHYDVLSGELKSTEVKKGCFHFIYNKKGQLERIEQNMDSLRDTDFGKEIDVIPGTGKIRRITYHSHGNKPQKAAKVEYYDETTGKLRKELFNYDSYQFSLMQEPYRTLYGEVITIDPKTNKAVVKKLYSHEDLLAEFKKEEFTRLTDN